MTWFQTAGLFVVIIGLPAAAVNRPSKWIVQGMYSLALMFHRIPTQYRGLGSVRWFPVPLGLLTLSQFDAGSPMAL